jgi:hypothetical protein
VYLLDSEGPTSVELREIIGGINGQRITLAIACPERLVNVRDVAAVIAKEPNLELEHPIIVPGGDFMLREGDAVTLELDSAIGSWVELERTWASWTYDDLLGRHWVRPMRLCFSATLLISSKVQARTPCWFGQ